MEIVSFGELTDERRAEIEGDEGDPFDAGDERTQFRSKDRHVAVREVGGRLVASAGLIVVDVEVGERRFPVVGLGGVIVNERHRGHGLARRVVEAAVEEARRLGPDVMMLFCRQDRMGLYERLGFREVAEEVRVQQPDGEITIDHRTMWRPLRVDARWPEGRVVVHSLPF